MTIRAELSLWNLSLSPGGPPFPAFMWLIPGLGERDMFTQPVLTMRIAQLFLLGACCPEPPLHPEAAPGEVWLKSLCPKSFLES